MNSLPACGRTSEPRRRQRRLMKRHVPALVFSPTPERSTEPSCGTSSVMVASSTWPMSTSRVSPMGDALLLCRRACSRRSADMPIAGACCSM